MESIEFILYVSDQIKSRDFYKKVLLKIPTLDVPGMTEFSFGDNCKLGLMPTNGITKILGINVPAPETGYGIPRCEVYIHVLDVEESYQRAIRAGAKEVSKPALRNWGDLVGYVSDLDGHIIAFAKK